MPTILLRAVDQIGGAVDLVERVAVRGARLRLAASRREPIEGGFAHGVADPHDEGVEARCHRVHDRRGCSGGVVVAHVFAAGRAVGQAVGGEQQILGICVGDGLHVGGGGVHRRFGRRVAAGRAVGVGLRDRGVVVGRDRHVRLRVDAARVVAGEEDEPPVDVCLRRHDDRVHRGRHLRPLRVGAAVGISTAVDVPTAAVGAGAAATAVRGSVMDPDLSCTMRMSGGSGMTGVLALAAGHAAGAEADVATAAGAQANPGAVSGHAARPGAGPSAGSGAGRTARQRLPGMPGLNPQPATEEIEKGFHQLASQPTHRGLHMGDFGTVPHITPICGGPYLNLRRFEPSADCEARLRGAIATRHESAECGARLRRVAARAVGQLVDANRRAIGQE